MLSPRSVTLSVLILQWKLKLVHKLMLLFGQLHYDSVLKAHDVVQKLRLFLLSTVNVIR